MEAYDLIFFAPLSISKRVIRTDFLFRVFHLHYASVIWDSDSTDSNHICSIERIKEGKKKKALLQYLSAGGFHTVHDTHVFYG